MEETWEHGLCALAAGQMPITSELHKAERFFLIRDLCISETSFATAYSDGQCTNHSVMTNLLKIDR